MTGFLELVPFKNGSQYPWLFWIYFEFIWIFFLFQVCTNCYKDTKTKHHGFLKADHPPPKKRRVNSHGPFSLPRDPAEYFDPAGNPAGTHPEGGLVSNPAQEEEKVAPADVTCPLCRRKFCKFSFKVLHCQPHAGSSYFPFLSELPMPEDYGEFFQLSKIFNYFKMIRITVGR